MADVALAREEIGKAVACLVNRVGFEADVHRHLTAALAALKDKSIIIEAEETASTEAAVVEEAASEVVPIASDAVTPLRRRGATRNRPR